LAVGPVARNGAVAICLGVLAVNLLGCGGGKDSGQKGAPPIPSADRAAFYGIATTSGSLRASAAPAALGQASGLRGRAELVAARRRLAALHPPDRRLAALRVKLVAALGAAVRPVHGTGAARLAAREALRATDAINAGLRSYAARHPATAALIPD
jgi:hypothetical protein